MPAENVDVNRGQLDDDERRELRRKARQATLDALQGLGGTSTRAEIRERALADGGFTPRELAAAPPTAAAEKFERAVDHRLSWALTELKRDGLVENPKWGTWKLVGAAVEAPETAAASPAPADRLAQLQAMPYREYLRTPEWRRTRAAALLRAGNSCSLDVTHTDHLEVHHRTYQRLGAELASDLVVLCRECHRLHHREFGRPKREKAGKDRRRAAAAPRRKSSLLRRLLAG
jgi:restriction endonuclease Mrr